jgi:threonine/homoserine/homoserine lactone efflux protein
MLISSGTKFGFIRTIPHLFGVVFGFGFVMLLCAAGVGTLVLAWPSITVVLRALASSYMLFLAWKLRNISFIKTDSNDGKKPLTFLGASAFQSVNPSAWVLGASGASALMPPIQPFFLSVITYCVVFSIINVPCLVLWAGAGSALRRCLEKLIWQRVFCTVMVLLTVYTAICIWFEA